MSVKDFFVAWVVTCLCLPLDFWAVVCLVCFGEEFFEV